ncbi:MAG TPA: alpha/beta fold hydrolase [Candidatus Thermoplasmatota archaeon]|nr:alpha/beta fold hydrolase [Candidatus Thermoplasmatota archaeon]
MDLVDLPHSDHGPRGATAVILLHGFPLDHRMWRAQKEALEHAGWRVIVPDLRGFGKAPPGRGAPGMKEYAGDVLRLADRAGLSRFVLVGFSMGGYVALEVARQAPDRLQGLALVDSRAEPDSDEARAGRVKTADAVRAQGAQVVADAMVPKMLTAGAPERLHAEVRDMMLAQPIEGIVAALHAMGARPDPRSGLPQLRVPTLLVVGEHDPITPPEASKAMAAAIPGARLQVIPGAAHLSPVEQPEAVNAALLAWLHELR